MAGVDKSRIQGFGSDGQKEKRWHCPAGHHLQPRKASGGKCSGCRHHVVSGEPVMDCRQCIFFLCNECHPQEKEEQDWFWGSLNFLLETAQQEIVEIRDEFKEMAGDVETFVNEMSFGGTCGPPVQAPKAEDVDADGARPRRKKGSKPPKSRSSSEDLSSVVASSSAFRAKAAKMEARCGSAEGPAPAAAPAAVEGAAAAGIAAAAEPVAAAESAPAAAAPPAPPEDLLDIGQNDLLDLDSEAPAQAPSRTPDDLLGFDAAPTTVAAGLVARSAADVAPLLLDLTPAATASLAQVAG